jgi:predicted N-acetyltransferase YhbS
MYTIFYTRRRKLATFGDIRDNGRYQKQISVVILSDGTVHWLILLTNSSFEQVI